MLKGWKIVFMPLSSGARHVSSHALVSSCLCSGLGCAVTFSLTESVCFSELPKDKMTNGDIGPEEKKQETEREKLLEDASAGENHR